MSQTIDDILETLPQVTFIKNNKQGDDIRFNNHVYSIKQKGKKACAFVCKTKGCNG